MSLKPTKNYKKKNTNILCMYVLYVRINKKKKNKKEKKENENYSN